MRFLFSKTKDNITTGAAPVASVQRFHCNVHSLSETGPVRQHNEDCIATYFFDDRREQLLCVLADGMGGHNAGEVASSIACNAILAHITQHLHGDGMSALNDAFQIAQKQIIQAGNDNPAQKGMGTTATALLIKDAGLSFAHIGDSRLYQFRDKTLTQLSRDHTLVNEMYERGEISKSERDVHSMKNILTQALGTTQTITPQLAAVPADIMLGDRYLLCSDGTYDVFTDEELSQLLQIKEPSFVLECIRCVAMDRKASDNFSVILVSFSDEVLRSAPITKEQNTMS